MNQDNDVPNEPKCSATITLWMDGESIDLRVESDDLTAATDRVMDMFYAVRLCWRGNMIAPRDTEGEG